MVASFRIRDPNNDPFNNDANGVLVGPWWRYQLPERVLRARYDLSISASLHIDLTGSSNFPSGTWFWGSWVNGFLAFLNDQGEVLVNFSSPMQEEFQGDTTVAVGAKPIFALMNATPYDSGDVGMNRSIEIAAADAPPEVLLGFPLLFWVDRGTARGLVRVNLRNAEATLRCTITQDP